MRLNPSSRRPYGSGSVFEHRNAWYGQWRVGGRLVKRKLGLMRQPGSRDGLTRTQAEARLRALMTEVGAAPPVAEKRLTVPEAGERLLIPHGDGSPTIDAYGLRVHAQSPPGRVLR